MPWAFFDAGDGGRFEGGGASDERGGSRQSATGSALSRFFASCKRHSFGRACTVAHQAFAYLAGRRSVRLWTRWKAWLVRWEPSLATTATRRW